MKTAIILAVALSSTLHLAASDLSIRASLDREHSLPGIPVTVRFDVTNGGKAEAKVPRLVGLGVTPAHQAAFAAGEVLQERMHTIPGFYEDDELVVRPGETRRFELPLGETLASGWFADPRLWKPGRFSLQVCLGEKLSPTALDDAIKTRSFIPGDLRSNEMEFKVETPEGDEARVDRAALDACAQSCVIFRIPFAQPIRDHAATSKRIGESRTTKSSV